MATFSYGGDPSVGGSDEIRFLVGDTGPVIFILCNEEYDYLVLQFPGNALAAAAAGADALCAKFAKAVDETTGDLQRKCSQKSKQYSALADKLRKQNSDPLTQNPIPFGGGISCDDIQTREDDLDRYPDIFHIGENDNEDGLGIKGFQPTDPQ